MGSGWFRQYEHFDPAPPKVPYGRCSRKNGRVVGGSRHMERELCPGLILGDIIRLTMPLAAGTKLNVYEVVDLLGAGGMGEVYRARDPALKRDVAIKVLPSFVSQDPDRLHRFEQEAQAAAALNHPNILAVYQFGVFEGAPYLVSELLEGDTLRQVLQRGPLPVRKTIDYARPDRSWIGGGP